MNARMAALALWALACGPALAQQELSFDALNGASWKDSLQRSAAVPDATGVALVKPKAFVERRVVPAQATAELPTGLQWLVSAASAPFTDHRHIIFWDAGVSEDDGTPDTRMMAYWRHQSESVKSQLLDRGVPSDSIAVRPIRSKEEFLRTVRAGSGPKSVYVFSHADTLRLQFGGELVDFRGAEDAGTLVSGNVSALSVYGCSFMAPDTAGLDLLRGHLRGKDLVVLGHTQPSTPFDDDTRHPTNPLLLEQVGSYCLRKKATR